MDVIVLGFMGLVLLIFGTYLGILYISNKIKGEKRK